MLTLSEETESLAYRVAEAQNVSVDAAVRHALEQQAQAASAPKSVDEDLVSDEEIARRRAVIRAFQHKFRLLPKLDPRPIQDLFDEINDI